MINHSIVDILQNVGFYIGLLAAPLGAISLPSDTSKALRTFLSGFFTLITWGLFGSLTPIHAWPLLEWPDPSTSLFGLAIHWLDGVALGALGLGLYVPIILTLNSFENEFETFSRRNPAGSTVDLFTYLEGLFILFGGLLKYFLAIIGIALVSGFFFIATAHSILQQLLPSLSAWWEREIFAWTLAVLLAIPLTVAAVFGLLIGEKGRQGEIPPLIPILALAFTLFGLFTQIFSVLLPQFGIRVV